jgi:hypothetical protein
MNLKFRKLVRFEVVSSEDEPDDVLRKKGERSQVEDLVPVLVDKVENLS